MRILQQQTLAKTVKFTGVGLHSGTKIQVQLHPAPSDTGIVFLLKGNDGSRVSIPATHHFVGGLTYNTGLKKDGVQIHTVEHLLSAFHGFRIDNAFVEIDNIEVPIMDGSAAPFVFLISEAGIKTQDKARRIHRITKPVRVESGEAWIEALPPLKSGLSIQYSIDFKHPVIGKMAFLFSENPRGYSQSIAPARTFGFLREVEYLRRQGLIRGASVNNAIVLDDHRVISGELRFKNEFVRHKILDFWGDIVLLGKPVIGHFKAHKAGHKLHAMLVSKILNTPGALVQVTAEDSPSQIAWEPATVIG